MKKMLLMLCLWAGGVCFGTLKAEEIVLRDLYGIMPLDNSSKGWDNNPFPLGRIVAKYDNHAVKVDFVKSAGNAHVVISRGDGSIVRQHSELNPQHITVDMSGAKAGRYLLEVYTDEDALGGMFEVK